MTRFWFRKNHELASPARVAEATNVVVRQEAYDHAKDATIHLLSALKQWPGFDSTGNINGVIDHTLVNIDRLDDALDDLRDQVDKLRGQQVAEMIRRSGHPSTTTIGGGADLKAGTDINASHLGAGVMEVSSTPPSSALPGAVTPALIAEMAKLRPVIHEGSGTSWESRITGGQR